MICMLAQTTAPLSTTWAQSDFLGIELWQYFSALAILLAGFLLKRFLEVVVIRWLVKLFSKTSFKYDELVVEALGRPLSAFVIVGCVHASAFILALKVGPGSIDFLGVIKKSYLVAVGVLIVWAAYRLVDVMAVYLDDMAAGKDDTLRGQFMPLIKQALRVFTIIVGTLTILATLDVDVVGLLAGLGIGGIAIALAAQDSVGNLIGTISVLADRPFKVGDWIIVGDKVDGYVEEIGFRSTKVRTWPKTLMSIPNKTIATEVIDNWSQMPKRRVKMNVGVTYSTTPEQMEQLLEGIRDILKQDEGVDQDFYLVRFTDFGSSSLDILLYYFTVPTGWDDHLAVRERINLKIMHAVKKLGLSIAFPTRSIHIESTPPGLGWSDGRPGPSR
jgi:MscS family membrane protein